MPIDKLSANAFATGAIANSLGYTPLSATAPSAIANSTANVAFFAANGNIGIGTSTPSSPFIVRSGSYDRLYLGSGIYDGVIVGRRLADDAYATLQLVSGGATNPKIEGAGESFGIFTGGSTRIAIGNTGVTAIQFAAAQSASADANTLDDYEEGTWTPTWSTGTATYGSRAARYTKIGNVVYYNCKIESTNVTSMSTVAINGLPFAASSENAQGYVTGSTFCVVGFQNLGSAGIAPQIIPGGTQIQLYIVTEASGANYTSLSATDVNEGSTLNLTVTGFYFV